MRDPRRNDNYSRRPALRRKRRIRRIGRIVTLSFSAVMGVFCLVQLVLYAGDFISSRRQADVLKAEYYAESVPETPAIPPQADNLPTEAPLPIETAAPAETMPPAGVVSDTEAGLYPLNHSLFISSRFQKIQRQNKDIIGWLHMEDILDQAVVQRDNSYYLRRDYQGYHNENGALFLDEYCNLALRPAIYIVWGHNMKTSAMFGCLRQFEDTHFYHNNPFITFDTMYEDGEFVIFAVCDLTTSRISEAMVLQNAFRGASKLIRRIKDSSLYTCPLEVDENDQLLMLVTCTGETNERRVVAARRIREDETKEQLLSIIGRAKKH